MSEIRVNTIVAAEGTSAPLLPYGVSVPTGMGITGAGGVNITGVVTATSFSGSGSALTGIAVTQNVRTESITVSGVSTFTGALNATSVVSSGAVSGTTGTFSSAVNVDATTDSTSATSGALIVDGGLGVAKNVYIGAGLSVAGTLTYEDVTNVDSVGLITAKSGVNVTGGQLQVGVAYSVGAAGVATAAGFVGPLTGNVTGDVTGSGANLTAGTVPLTSLDLDGGTDIGAGLADADLFIVDDAAGGTNRKSAASRIKTYIADVTLTTAAQTNITSLGSLSALTVTGNLTLDNGADAGKDLTWNTAGDALEFADDVYANFGGGNDLKIYHDGSNSYIEQAGTGSLYIRPKTGEDGITLTGDGAVTLSHDNGTRFTTTGAGSTSVGISTVQDFSCVGMLKEKCQIVANKLSGANGIDLYRGNIWYFTTNETTTAQPSIRWSSLINLNNKMVIGEAVTVTIIYKPNGAGYYDSIIVDGSNVTEEWLGGSAPSSANAGGYDVLTHTLVKTAADTFLCLSNVQNFA